MLRMSKESQVFDARETQSQERSYVRELLHHCTRSLRLAKRFSHSVVWIGLAFLAVGLSPTLQAQTAPTGLANGTPHSTGFTWVASVPVTGVTLAGYNLYCGPTAGSEAGTKAVNGATPIAGTSYTDTAVIGGQTQFCVVAAQATTGNQSGFSNEVSFTNPNNPNPPTSLSAPLVAINRIGTKETLTASWTDVPGRTTAYVIWNGQTILKKGTVTDTGKTGNYAISWSGNFQPTYVQVFDTVTADPPTS